MSESEYAAPKPGISVTPAGLERFMPASTICATLVPCGSLTARAPVNVAYSLISLMPLHPWQLTQAPSYTCLPRDAAAARPSLCESGAAGASLAGKSEDTLLGTLRKYATIAWTSSGANWLKLSSTASPIGPAADP